LLSPPPAPGEINLPILQQPKSQYVESVSLSVSQPAGGMSTCLPVMCFRFVRSFRTVDLGQQYDTVSHFGIAVLHADIVIRIRIHFL
jgi:hypothetical protein